MGSYDGAEVCELVGLFLLSKVKNEFKDLDFGPVSYTHLTLPTNREV